jgi:hypothetical protein
MSSSQSRRAPRSRLVAAASLGASASGTSSPLGAALPAHAELDPASHHRIRHEVGQPVRATRASPHRSEVRRPIPTRMARSWFSGRRWVRTWHLRPFQLRRWGSNSYPSALARRRKVSRPQCAASTVCGRSSGRACRSSPPSAPDRPAGAELRSENRRIGESPQATGLGSGEEGLDQGIIVLQRARQASPLAPVLRAWVPHPFPRGSSPAPTPLPANSASATGGGWSGSRDLNPGPLGPQPSALPGCATPRTRGPL